MTEWKTAVGQARVYDLGFRQLLRRHVCGLYPKQALESKLLGLLQTRWPIKIARAIIEMNQLTDTFRFDGRLQNGVNVDRTNRGATAMKQKDHAALVRALDAIHHNFHRVVGDAGQRISIVIGSSRQHQN